MASKPWCARIGPASSARWIPICSGLRQELRRVGYFETEHHRKLIKDLKATIQQGQLVALAGLVGCGKTTLAQHLQETLRAEKEILVSQSLAVDKDRVNIATLMLAMFYDLATEKDFKVPTQPEKRERKLIEVIRKRQKPVALFIDEAHELHNKTLVRLKRLIELVQHNGATLSVVLVGHPKLKNDLRRSSLEEIGARASIFLLEGIQGEQRAYIEWLLGQCARPEAVGEILTSEAIELLAEHLVTPLQVEQHLTLALEEAYRVGQKPVSAELIEESILTKDRNDLEPRLIRYGYNAKTLAELLNVRPFVITQCEQAEGPILTQSEQEKGLVIEQDRLRY